MEQKYHFIKNGTKLLGITLVVFIFMKWILPVVIPFFVAYFIAGRVRKSGGEKREKSFCRIILTIGVIILIGILFWYLSRELMDLWKRKDELLYWEGAKESGLFGRLYEKLIHRFQGEALLDQIAENMASPLGGMKDTLGGFVTIAVTVVATIIMIGEYDSIQEKLQENSFGSVILALGKDLSVVGGDYLKAQAWIMLIITGICVLALFLVRNPYAVFVGVMIGFCDALPFIGTSLIFIPWAVLMFLQKKIWLGIYYVFLAGATSLLRQYLEPKLIGHRVGANPLIVLISIYLGVQVFGIWGVVLGPASAFLIWEIYRFT